MMTAKKNVWYMRNLSIFIIILDISFWLSNALTSPKCDKGAVTLSNWMSSPN